MNKTFGLTIFQKDLKDQLVLKDLLQLIKGQSGRKTLSFAHVEAQSSMIPHLTLWENLQLVVGKSNWNEVLGTVEPKMVALMRLVENPDLKSADAAAWEKFIISLLKGISAQDNILVDMNEELLSPILIRNIKEILIDVAASKNVYLASASPALWLDCSHTLVKKNGYEFVFEVLDEASLKRHWVA